MKNSFLLSVLLCVQLAAHAQLSRVERIANIVFHSVNYQTGILSQYDSVAYIYPNLTCTGGLEQQLNSQTIETDQAVALQYFTGQLYLGTKPTTRRWISKNSSENSMTLSTIDFNTNTLELEYISDTILQFSEAGMLNRIQVIFYPDSPVKSYNHISYTYNEASLLIADTTFLPYSESKTPKINQYRTFEYNEQQQLISIKGYANNGLLISHKDYTYDEQGRLVRITYPLNGNQTIYAFSKDGSTDTVISITTHPTMIVTQRFDDRVRTMGFARNDSNEWYLNSIKTELLNNEGLVVLLRNEYLSTHLLANGQFWYVADEETRKYNEYSHLIFSERKTYSEPFDTLLTQAKIFYHWEPILSEAKDNALQLQCSPIPAREFLDVNFVLPEKGLYELNLIHLNGKTVLRKETSGKTGMNQERLTLANLIPGCYIVLLQQGKHYTSTKILIQ